MYLPYHGTCPSFFVNLFPLAFLSLSFHTCIYSSADLLASGLSHGSFPRSVSFFHLLVHYSYKLKRVTCFWSLLRTTPLYITYSRGYKVPRECFAQNINFISLFTLIYIQCIFVCNYDLDKFVCPFIWEIYKPRERELFFNLCTPGLP